MTESSADCNGLIAVNTKEVSPGADPTLLTAVAPELGEWRGLTAAEVSERIARGQVNRTPRSAWAAAGDIVRRNLFTLFNALVVPAAIALFLLKEYPGAWAVSGMALVNTVIGLVQEVRAKRHLDHLAVLVEARARVLRDGEVRTLPAG